MLDKILKIFRKEEKPIEEITIERLLKFMANNQEEYPKDLPECVNFRFLNEDDKFLYYGRVKTKECRQTKNVVVKVSRQKVLTALPNLKKINGWEFSSKTIENSNFSFSQLTEEFLNKGIHVFKHENEHFFQINDDTINYKIILKITSDGQLIKKIEMIESFDKEKFEIIKK